ncbi:hypothetical protein NHX12_020928, partial [Muraenolepis orangiensis]
SLDELEDDDGGERERKMEQQLVQANTVKNEGMSPPDLDPPGPPAHLLQCRYPVPLPSAATQCRYPVPLPSAATQCRYLVSLPSTRYLLPLPGVTSKYPDLVPPSGIATRYLATQYRYPYRYRYLVPLPGAATQYRYPIPLPGTVTWCNYPVNSPGAGSAEEDAGGSARQPRETSAYGSLERRVEELEKELAGELQENDRLMKAHEDKDDLIGKLKEEIDLLNRRGGGPVLETDRHQAGDKPEASGIRMRTPVRLVIKLKPMNLGIPSEYE